MHVRHSELQAVAVGLGEFDVSPEGNMVTLVEALRRLPAGERAPAWELATRRFAQRKPLAHAAGEIGLDERRAQDLLERFTATFTEAPALERAAPLPESPAERDSSGAARYLAPEVLANARASGEAVDLEARHDASLRAVEALKQHDPGAV